MAYFGVIMSTACRPGRNGERADAERASGVASVNSLHLNLSSSDLRQSYSIDLRRTCVVLGLRQRTPHDCKRFVEALTNGPQDLVPRSWRFI